MIVSSQVGHLPTCLVQSPTCGCACRPLGAPRCTGKDENIAGAIRTLLRPAPFAFLFWQETLILRIASPLNKRKDLMFIHRSHLPVNAFELHLCNFGKWWQLLLNYLLNHWSTPSNQTFKISRWVHIMSNQTLKRRTVKVQRAAGIIYFPFQIYLPVKLSVHLPQGSKSFCPFQRVGEFHDKRFSLMLV